MFQGYIVFQLSYQLPLLEIIDIMLFLIIFCNSVFTFSFLPNLEKILELRFFHFRKSSKQKVVWAIVETGSKQYSIFSSAEEETLMMEIIENR